MRWVRQDKIKIKLVMIYIQTLTIRMRNEVKLRNEYADQVWVELSLRNKDNLLCGCIYRSPTKERVSTIETMTKIAIARDGGFPSDNF